MMSSTYSEENLIENVRAHTLLYDMFSEDYRDLNRKKEAWEEIGDALKIPGKYYVILFILFPKMQGRTQMTKIC